MAGSAPIREPISNNGRLTPVWARYFTTTLNPVANQTIEQIRTNFKEGSILFVDGGFLNEDNEHFTFDKDLKKLKINGTISGKNRAKQYFFSGM